MESYFSPKELEDVKEPLVITFILRLP